MHRLFVAIRPPEDIRDQLIDLMEGVEGARWQDDEQLHLTLRFIGEVDGCRAEDIAMVLGTVHQVRFELALRGVGSFESSKRPPALWAGVFPAEPLALLHRKIDQALVRIGLEPERRAYKPHITLARLNRSSGAVGPFLQHHFDLSSQPFRVDDFALFESRLTQAGPIYRVVETYPLQKE